MAAAEPIPTPMPPSPSPTCTEVQYLSWVWKFSVDGPADEIATVLSDSGLGVIVKTHKGVHWMAEEDGSADAVTGPAQVANLAQYFEGRGVPFHAYMVVQGLDPQREAEMAAEVLAAGARSLFLDLEPWNGYWQGSAEAAVEFGRELRRLAPGAVVVTVIEPRPWALDGIPLAEFAEFSDALAPMVYWETFNSQPNIDAFEARGWPPGPSGVTPEFLLDVSMSLFQPYGLPLQPVGQGAASDLEHWERYLDRAEDLGMPHSSVFRHGVTNSGLWEQLKARTPC